MPDLKPPGRSTKPNFWSRRSPWSGDGAGDGLPVVEGYRVLSEAGTGGFSLVYAAEEIRAGRRVALKVARSKNREARDRFAAEAAIGERLVAAQGIVGTLAQVRTSDGRPVLVMPYYDLGHAGDLLRPERRPTQPMVVEIIRQVAQGLDAMHRQHFLHRDVSPRNVLRSLEMGFAIGDLGCARAFNSTVHPPWTEALTPGFAAPEADSDTAVQTISSDVYGLAATAWALFTGTPPYGPQPDPAALELSARYELRRSTQPPGIEPLRMAGVPADAAELLVGALDPDPARRPARVLDFSNALSAAIGQADQNGQAQPVERFPPVADVSAPISAGWSEERTIPNNLSPPGRTAPAPFLPTSPTPSRAQSPTLLPTPLPTPPRTPPATNRASAPGPIQPPDVRPAQTGDPTELAGPNQRKPVTPVRRDRRWPTLLAVLTCFVVGFVVVRLTVGSGHKPSAPAASPAPGTSATTATGGPRDLAITQDSGRRLRLTWTPPAATDAIPVLYRSTDGGRWHQLDLDLAGTKGKAVVTVPTRTHQYCFRLVVVAGAAPGVNSNQACTTRS